MAGVDAEWTYDITNLNTGEIIERDIPATVASFDVGGGIANGGLGGFLPFDGPQHPVDSLLIPWQRVMWARFGGVPIGCPYVIMGKPRATDDGIGQGFTAVSAGEIFKRRKLCANMAFSEQDVFDIARAVAGYGIGDLTHLGAVVASLRGLIGLPWPTGYALPWFRLGGGQSGIVRSVADTPTTGYLETRDLMIDQILTALADETGFEMRVDAGEDDTGLYAELVFGAPQVGRMHEVTLQVEAPGDVVGWAYGADGADIVTAARAFGTSTPAGGSGTVRTPGPIVPDEQALADGFPILFPATSPVVENTTDPATLTAYATGAIVGHRGLKEGFELTLAERDAVGMFGVGDTIRAKFDHIRWPYGTREVDLRVEAIRYEPVNHLVIPSVKPPRP